MPTNSDFTAFVMPALCGDIGCMRVFRRVEISDVVQFPAVPDLRAPAAYSGLPGCAKQTASSPFIRSASVLGVDELAGLPEVLDPVVGRVAVPVINPQGWPRTIMQSPSDSMTGHVVFRHPDMNSAIVPNPSGDGAGRSVPAFDFPSDDAGDMVVGKKGFERFHADKIVCSHVAYLCYRLSGGQGRQVLRTPSGPSIFCFAKG